MDKEHRPLTTRLAAGEAPAFSELYDTYVPALHGWLWARTGRREAAEDIVQAVMLRVVRHREGLGRVRDLRAWRFAVARNEWRRTAGRDRRTVQAEEPMERAVPDGMAPDAEEVRRHGARLPAERREVVVLHAWHDLGFGEIGRLLDVSPNTAASRWRLALVDLARWCGKDGHDEQ